MTISQLDGQEIGHFLTNRFGDRYLYGVNRNVFDQVGSDTVLRHHFGERFVAEDTLHFVIGADSGLAIRYLLKRGIPPGSRYVFLELPKVIDLVRGDLGELLEHDQIALCELDEWRRRAEDFSFSNYVFVDHIQQYQSVGAEDAYLTDYLKLWHRFRQEFATAYYAVRQQLGHRQFMLRQLENLPENRVPAGVLKKTFNGHTAVVLGAGPSLTQFLPWLKANREKLVVFAVSRMCHHLPGHGIVPDFVVSVDPHDFNFEYGKSMLQFWEHAVFIHANHVSPLLLSAWRGNSVYLADRYPWKNSVEPDNTVRGGGPTVSNAAMNAAAAFGFSQVILTGVDLCFSNDLYMYAQGDGEPVSERSFSVAGQQVVTNGGWLADTIDDFAVAREAFSIQAKAAREEYGCRIINIAVNAARIDGIDFVPPEEVELFKPPASVGQLLERHFPQTGPEARLGHYRDTREELQRLRQDVEKVKALAEEALSCNDGLFGRGGKEADFTYKLRMDEIEETLDRDHTIPSLLTKRFGITRFVKVIRPDIDKEWTDEEIERWGRTYYEAYRDSAQELIDLIDSTVKRLDARADEEAAWPDVDRLLEQWKEDKQPGRALLWRERRRDIYERLDNELRARIDAMVAEFDHRLYHISDGLAEQIDEYTNLKGIRAKALEHFKRHEKDKLERFRDGLAERGEEEAAWLQHLVSGLLAELEGDPDEAQRHYSAITETRYSEDALRQLMMIQLNQDRIDDALETLERLSRISITFFPHFAELNQIAGNYQKAVDLYTKYLEAVPDDLKSMMKLGTLYHRLGVGEGVRWIMGYILEKDPTNEAARRMLAEVEGRP